MSDLSAGTTVKALDFPPTVTVGDATSIGNITSTAYITGTPTVETTFVAPTTGRVVLTVSAIIRDNGGDNRGFVSPEVYEGTGTGGTQIVGANVRQRGVGAIGEASNYQANQRRTLLEGLTPGATYYARLVYKVSGGTSVDILFRGLIIKPAT